MVNAPDTESPATDQSVQKPGRGVQDAATGVQDAATTPASGPGGTVQTRRLLLSAEILMQKKRRRCD